jgi:hypothetical protein
MSLGKIAQNVALSIVVKIDSKIYDVLKVGYIL